MDLSFSHGVLYVFNHSIKVPIYFCAASLVHHFKLNKLHGRRSTGMCYASNVEYQDPATPVICKHEATVYILSQSRNSFTNLKHI